MIEVKTTDGTILNINIDHVGIVSTPWPSDSDKAGNKPGAWIELTYKRPNSRSNPQPVEESPGIIHIRILRARAKRDVEFKALEMALGEV